MLYGLEEREIHQDESRHLDDHTWRISYNWGPLLLNNSWEYREKYFCFCIKYGPTNDDWEIWDDCAAIYEYAEDFWNMIESPWE
jgi:hypothetical protein